MVKRNSFRMRYDQEKQIESEFFVICNSNQPICVQTRDLRVPSPSPVEYMSITLFFLLLNCFGIKSVLQFYDTDKSSSD